MNNVKQIVVIGGTGFVGSALVSILCGAGYTVNVLTRHRESAKHLIVLPHVKLTECNVHDAHALKLALAGSDAVINLVGILHESGRQSFEEVHHQLPRRIAHLCEELGIDRLLHMSALGADAKAPSKYLRSKAAGEAALQEYQQRLHITVFRPSVIFGRGDHFLNLFATLMRYLPVLLLAKPNARFQPIWVGDVARTMTISLQNPYTYAKIYELGGPDIYTLRALMLKVAGIIGVKRAIIGLNDTFSYLQAAVMSLLPGKLLTKDNLDSMKTDNVCAGKFPAVFGFEPAALDTIVPEYLGCEQTQRGKYQRYRAFAGR